MELSKTDKKQLREIIKRGILRRCEEWLRQTASLIASDYGENENAFDRCMEVTKRSRDYYKEAMRREDYYSGSMVEIGVTELLHAGYLTEDDLAELRDEVRSRILFRHNL